MMSESSGAQVQSSFSLTTLHQDHRATGYNRYPRICSRVAEVATTIKSSPRRILSFGCSTGDEPKTLSELYFPGDHIVGVDISKDAIEQARKGNFYPDRIEYHQVSSTTFDCIGKFDIIFAMAVLCRWPESQGMTDISGIYPFERFDQAVRSLDALLNCSGLLVIANSNFSFTLSSVSNHYEMVGINIEASGFVERFDECNQRIEGAIPADCIYKKLREAP
jgi:SAM-dependent methyltransferase